MSNFRNRVLILLLGSAVAMTLLTRAHSPVPVLPLHRGAHAAAESKVPSRASMPMMFESNVGQSAPEALFLSHGRAETIFITRDRAVFSLTPSRPTGHSIRTSASNQQRIADSVLTMKLVGAQQNLSVRGQDPLKARINYFIGRDPNRWHRNVPAWRGVAVNGAWRGIDVDYHAETGEFVCDFVVHPGAKPDDIRLAFDGAFGAHISAGGDLVMTLGRNAVHFVRPGVYQEINGARREVPARFTLESDQFPRGGHGVPAQVVVGFDVADYDRSARLTIDPTLVYSSFFGGSGSPDPFRGADFVDQGDSVNSLAVDKTGVYVTGISGSADFPTTTGSFQQTCPNKVNCNTGFVAKLDPTGSSLIYATYLGGSGGAIPSMEPISGIAVDASGEAFVAGNTESSDFPTTPGAYQPKSFQGGGFVAKLSADGSSLIYATYLSGATVVGCGGADCFGLSMSGIAVDAAGNAYVTGAGSPGFPVTPNGAFPNSANGGAVAAVLDPTGSKILYSAALGSGWGRSIALGPHGYIYLVGSDYAGTIPTTGNAFEKTCVGCGNVGTLSTNGFLTVLNPAAATASQSLIYSSYLGGSVAGSFYADAFTGDAATSVAIDADGRAYLGGITGRTDFPLTSKAYQTSCQKTQFGNCVQGFVAILDPSAATGSESLVYSSYLGGSDLTWGYSIAVDSAGRAYLAGETYAKNFPVTSNAIETSCISCTSNFSFATATGAGFLTVLNPFATSIAAQLVYSTYLGGTGTTGNPYSPADAANAVVLDADQHVYVGGLTWSSDFPVTAGAYETLCRGCAPFAFDGFVTELDPVSGSLIFSTFLGGSGLRVGGEVANAVALDNSGKIYLAGLASSVDFPATPGAFEKKCRACIPYAGFDAFVAKLDPTAIGDDQLIYATYLGGSSPFGDEAFALAVDPAGEAYVAGGADSADFPTTANAFQPRCLLCAESAGSSAFFSKLDATGSNLLYSTYLSGSLTSIAYGVAIDPQNHALVSGQTYSADFPTTPNAFMNFCLRCGLKWDGYTAFVSKLDPSAASPAASLVYSTLFGGSGVPATIPANGEIAAAITSDANGDAIITGQTWSMDLPVTTNAYMTKCPTVSVLNSCDSGFVTVIDPSAPTGSQIRYSTYFGGNQSDYPTGVAVDAIGRLYLTGHTFSLSFPTSPNAFMPACGGSPYSCNTAFVSALDPSQAPAAQLMFSTYLGGAITSDDTDPNESAESIKVDADGDIFVTGSTGSEAFPVTPDAVQSLHKGFQNIFLTELNPAASGAAQLVYSTLLGGSGQQYAESGDIGKSVALDSSGRVVIAGYSTSHDFPVTDNAYQTNCPACQNIGGGDAVVAQFQFPTPAITITPTAVPSVIPTPMLMPTATPTPTISFTPTPTATITPVASQLTIQPDTLKFGDVAVGKARIKQVNVDNAKGGQFVFFQNYQVTGPFAASGGTCPFQTGVGPGQSCYFEFRFSPTGVGKFGGTFSITTNSTKPPPLLSLHGKGVKEK